MTFQQMPAISKIKHHKRLFDLLLNWAFEVKRINTLALKYGSRKKSRGLLT